MSSFPCLLYAKSCRHPSASWLAGLPKAAVEEAECVLFCAASPVSRLTLCRAGGDPRVLDGDPRGPDRDHKPWWRPTFDIALHAWMRKGDREIEREREALPIPHLWAPLCSVYDPPPNRLACKL